MKVTQEATAPSQAPRSSRSKAPPEPCCSKRRTTTALTSPGFPRRR
jgi:hypothetical protein